MKSIKGYLIYLSVFLFTGMAVAQEATELTTLQLQPGLVLYDGSIGIQLSAAFLEKDALIEFLPFLPINETQGMGLFTKRVNDKNLSETGFYLTSTFNAALNLPSTISTFLNVGLSAVEKTDPVRKNGLAIVINPEVHFLPNQLDQNVHFDFFVGLNASIGSISVLNGSGGATLKYVW